MLRIFVLLIFIMSIFTNNFITFASEANNKGEKITTETTIFTFSENTANQMIGIESV